MFPFYCSVHSERVRRHDCRTFKRRCSRAPPFSVYVSPDLSGGGVSASQRTICKTCFVLTGAKIIEINEYKKKYI